MPCAGNVPNVLTRVYASDSHDECKNIRLGSSFLNTITHYVLQKKT